MCDNLCSVSTISGYAYIPITCHIGWLCIIDVFLFTVNLIAGDLAGKHLVVSGEPVIVDDATLWSYGTSKDSGQGGHRDRPNAECVACEIQQILKIGRGQAIVFLCGQGTDASPFCSFFICSDALAYVLTLKFSVSIKCPHLVTNTYGTITAHQHGEAGASLLLRFANFEGFSVTDFHEAGRARLCIGAPEGRKQYRLGFAHINVVVALGIRSWSLWQVVAVIGNRCWP